MLTKIYENRSFGNTLAIDLVKTLSRIVDVERPLGLLLSLIDRPYAKLLHPVRLSRHDIVISQILMMVMSFFLSLMIVFKSPVLGCLLFLSVPALVLIPKMMLNTEYEKQKLLVLMEIPVFLETFQVFLRHSNNTYSSFNSAINSVKVLAPYLSAISNNWGLDADKYIDELQNTIRINHVETLCRVLKNLAHKNPQEAITYFEFHSNRINKYVEQLEQEKLNAGPSKSGMLVILPYGASIMLIIIPFLKQIMGLL
jgi:hypothetical protein